MSLLIILLCIVLLVVLISWVKITPFLSFLIVSILAGWLLGIPLTSITQSVKKGIGDMLGELIITICVGAMLGKLVAESGAARKISDVLMHTFGKKYFQWAMMVTGFIVGIPLFYNVGFVLLIPLIFSVVYETKLPAVYVGVPMLAALSVTHGFLPPHPSPTALVAQFHANMGITLIYGVCLAIPAIIIAGPVFARTLKGIDAVPLKTFQPKEIPPEQLPGALNSFLSALLPVLLLMITTAVTFAVSANSREHDMIVFLGDPVIVMLVSLLVATWTLGLARGMRIQTLMAQYGEAVKDIALILLIVAGAGALKEVLTASGVSKTIGASLSNLSINPLLLGWMIAALIRVCVGSATVAGLTAAGIMSAAMTQPGINPNLMVLSIGAGSLMFSHVNDSGFWMFKEYFNLSIKDTIRSWSVMETIVSVVGLVGVLVFDIFV